MEAFVNESAMKSPESLNVNEVKGRLRRPAIHEVFCRKVMGFPPFRHLIELIILHDKTRGYYPELTKGVKLV
jgi:hypothetical protein